jgi:multicomponent Na+:H+ antiporter subunit G
MSAAVDIASWALLVAGGVFCAIGGIGLIRLPDVFARLHGASVIDTLGVGLLIAGMALQAGFTLVTLKLFIILFLIGLTSPVATHALAQAALHAGVKPNARDLDDEADGPAGTGAGAGTRSAS